MNDYTQLTAKVFPKNALTLIETWLPIRMRALSQVGKNKTPGTNLLTQSRAISLLHSSPLALLHLRDLHSFRQNRMGNFGGARKKIVRREGWRGGLAVGGVKRSRAFQNVNI